jgi:hypothetical protein
MFRTLDSVKLIGTLRKLRSRIEERFPEAGLAKVCGELTALAEENRGKIVAISRPHLPLRLGVATLLAIGIALIAYVATIIDVKRDTDNLFGVLQGIEALFNIVLLMGAAVLFLVTVEERIKRHRALKDLHELRSIVHVIDMHQLTKDPVAGASVGIATPSSPPRTLTPYELMRYLDYCSEMLSLTAKTAALYAQSLRDPVVVNAVNDIESLTANLSQKIWQKIMILQAGATGQNESAATPPAAGAN